MNGLGVKQVVYAKWGGNIGTLNRKFDLQRLVSIYYAQVRIFNLFVFA